MNSVYGSDTVIITRNFGFIDSVSIILMSKLHHALEGQLLKMAIKYNEIVESDHHVSTVSIAQELNIAQKTVWYHLNKAGYKKKLDVCMYVCGCHTS